MADLTIYIDCTETTCSNCLLLNGWGFCTAYNMAELETVNTNGKPTDYLRLPKCIDEEARGLFTRKGGFEA